MDLVGIDRAGAIEVVERITRHVPASEPAGEPRVIYPDVVITEYDERFAIEIDHHGSEFVTRVRAVGGGNTELTAFQGGRELGRRVAPFLDDPPGTGQ